MDVPCIQANNRLNIKYEMPLDRGLADGKEGITLSFPKVQMHCS